VSLSSVSRALNGGKNVSAKVARDVAEAAGRLGYQPDLLARSLRTRSSGMVGCLVSDVSNPLNASIVRAAEARLRDAGYLMVVASTANDPERERAATGEFRRRRLDGIRWRPAAMPTARPGESSAPRGRPSSWSIAIRSTRTTMSAGPPSWSTIAAAPGRRRGI
jgi:LacI family transcriptional regulator